MTQVETIPSSSDDAGTPRRFTPGRVLGCLVALGIVVFWVWAFSPLAPNRKVDALADRSFVPAANAQCRAAKASIDKLPPAQDATSAAARADIVVQSNQIVAQLLRDLRADTASATGRDRELLDQWLADWDTYVASRERYLNELRTEPDPRFTVPARSGGQITETMDGFSRVNRLFDCLVPLDV